MKVGIIQNKVEFKCTYDERQGTFNIQIPEREIRKNLIDKPYSKIVDLYLEIAWEESEDKERNEINRIGDVDVFDKIISEIMQVANQEKFHDEKWALGLRYAVNIIDKYNVESEGLKRNDKRKNLTNIFRYKSCLQ